MAEAATGEGSGSGDQKVQVKFLFSTAGAGSIIGKGGATIAEFQNSSKAKIQLSKAGEFFPGTSLRIVQLSGSLLQVATGLQLILKKLQDESLVDSAQNFEKEEEDESEEGIEVQMTAPIRLCGAIIGKEGSTINHFKEDSGASIKVQALNTVLPGVQERVIIIGGTTSKVLRAMCLIVTKMSEDSNYQTYIGQPINSSTQVGLLNASFTQGSRDYHFQRSQYDVTIGIPEEEVGAIIGRGGASISEIQQACRVRVKISDKGEYIPGTNERKVIISGTHDAVEMAQLMMSQKLRQANSQRSRSNPVMVQTEYD
eukprot:TRINITY_DN10002_c0_g2_i1.p1 TRINITY_DN10002_c0_g2~~TRINITY_DN10002_c0_g2_i1.p1  ORF type:complete len:313 (-),score=52.48 TRINITY_DN10002_c0_g2_i1:311-1249(-)